MYFLRTPYKYRIPCTESVHHYSAFYIPLCFSCPVSPFLTVKSVLPQHLLFTSDRIKKAPCSHCCRGRAFTRGSTPLMPSTLKDERHLLLIMITVLNRTVLPPLRGSLQMVRDKRLPANGLSLWIRFHILLVSSPRFRFSNIE